MRVDLGLKILHNRDLLLASLQLPILCAQMLCTSAKGCEMLTAHSGNESAFAALSLQDSCYIQHLLVSGVDLLADQLCCCLRPCFAFQGCTLKHPAAAGCCLGRESP